MRQRVSWDHPGQPHGEPMCNGCANGVSMQGYRFGRVGDGENGTQTRDLPEKIPKKRAHLLQVYRRSITQLPPIAAVHRTRYQNDGKWL